MSTGASGQTTRNSCNQYGARHIRCSPCHSHFRSRQAPISMWLCTGLASSKLTLLSRLGATRGTTNRQGLFLSDFHGYIMHVYFGTSCSIVTTESRHAYTLDRGPSHSATDVGSNDQLKYGDVREFNLVYLKLPDGLRWAKIPLLTDNFSKRAAPVRRASQDELLGARCFVLLKNE